MLIVLLWRPQFWISEMHWTVWYRSAVYLRLCLSLSIFCVKIEEILLLLCCWSGSAENTSNATLFEVCDDSVFKMMLLGFCFQVSLCCELSHSCCLCSGSDSGTFSPPTCLWLGPYKTVQAMQFVGQLVFNKQSCCVWTDDKTDLFCQHWDRMHKQNITIL